MDIKACLCLQNYWKWLPDAMVHLVGSSCDPTKILNFYNLYLCSSSTTRWCWGKHLKVISLIVSMISLVNSMPYRRAFCCLFYHSWNSNWRLVNICCAFFSFFHLFSTIMKNFVNDFVSVHIVEHVLRAFSNETFCSQSFTPRRLYLWFNQSLTLVCYLN